MPVIYIMSENQLRNLYNVSNAHRRGALVDVIGRAEIELARYVISTDNPDASLVGKYRILINRLASSVTMDDHELFEKNIITPDNMKGGMSINTEYVGNLMGGDLETEPDLELEEMSIETENGYGDEYNDIEALIGGATRKNTKKGKNDKYAELNKKLDKGYRDINDLLGGDASRDHVSGIDTEEISLILNGGDVESTECDWELFTEVNTEKDNTTTSGPQQTPRPNKYVLTLFHRDECPNSTTYFNEDWDNVSNTLKNQLSDLGLETSVVNISKLSKPEWNVVANMLQVNYTPALVLMPNISIPNQTSKENVKKCVGKIHDTIMKEMLIIPNKHRANINWIANAIRNHQEK